MKKLQVSYRRLAGPGVVGSEDPVGISAPMQADARPELHDPAPGWKRAEPAGVRLVSVSGSGTGCFSLRPGDRIVRVNGYAVRDELDVRFYGQTPWIRLTVVRGPDGKGFSLRIPGDELRCLTFEPLRPARCRNRCIFCFVDQLPPGLRSSLYFKDEDYRFSFLYGNFVTLSSLTDAELDRILEQRMQPLYVSVHATEEPARNFMLGRDRSRNILETLRTLAGHGLTVHTQIVLCPGINDGHTLVRTLEDLAALYPSVASIAVVPVGLTRHREKRGLTPLRPVTRKDALEALSIVSGMAGKFWKRYRDPLVHGADELYLRAGLPFPSPDKYGDFPQWENGVGMIASFYAAWRRQKRRRTAELRQACWDGTVAAVTGELAYPHVKLYLDWLERSRGVRVHLIRVPNRFFGRRVRVAGLVTGEDLVREVKGSRWRGRVIVLPAVMLDRDQKRFLDDVTLSDVEEETGCSAVVFRPDPEGFESTLAKVFGR